MNIDLTTNFILFWFSFITMFLNSPYDFPFWFDYCVNRKYNLYALESNDIHIRQPIYLFINNRWIQTLNILFLFFIFYRSTTTVLDLWLKFQFEDLLPFQFTFWPIGTITFSVQTILHGYNYGSFFFPPIKKNKKIIPIKKKLRVFSK